MQALELKVPPLLLTGLCVPVMVLAAYAAKDIAFAWFGICLAGFAASRRAGRAADPTAPDAATVPVIALPSPSRMNRFRIGPDERAPLRRLGGRLDRRADRVRRRI